MCLKEKKQYAIGIDAGTNTGFAIWDITNKTFIQIKTMKIHAALELVRQYKDHDIHVFVEDARKATFGRKKEAYKAQGAGSVKRDAAIWEGFLTDYKIPFTMKRPNKRLTKIDESTFSNLTKYNGRTSNHARDAAMLVFGITENYMKKMCK